jgi:hypothetical protein
MAKKKIKRNITGLRNQSKTVSHVDEAPDVSEKGIKISQIHLGIQIHADIVDDSEQSDDVDNRDEGWDPHIKLDSNKPCWELDDEGEDSEDEYTDKDEADSDVEDEAIEADEDEWRNEGLHVGLMVLAIEIGDDPRDEDWIPNSLRRKQNARIARGKF